MVTLLAPGSPAAVVTPRLRSRGGRDRLVVAGSGLIALALLLPLALLALDARTAGWNEVRQVLFRQRSLFLLRHTLVLSVLVVVLAAAIGVAAAWCTERSELPGRRAWTVLLVLPVAIPDFVISYAWHSLAPP
jgi:iron(III) transport system permease protein